ncbi:MAG: hypothetical protein GPJ54_14090 [Candidatus Heimdallarchaeota archaeon]|nr:hypothetical protein [Candidatus Heimdallarchaeota archaeon]
MAFEIPNIATLGIELSVAFLILVVDQRSRRRERNAILRSQKIDNEHREQQHLQMERFSGWIQEDSKRQLMMLESIMVSLDAEKAKIFRTEVGQRYTNEISRDLDDLEELLEKREELGIEGDRDLESDINQKIDELTSAEKIAGSFLSKSFQDSLKAISNTAKEAFIHMSDISELKNIEIDDNETGDIQIPLSDKKMDQFKDDKEKLMTEIETLKFEIGKTIAASTNQVTGKISNIFDPTKLEKGIKDLVSKIGSKKSENQEEDSED